MPNAYWTSPTLIIKDKQDLCYKEKFVFVSGCLTLNDIYTANYMVYLCEYNPWTKLHYTLNIFVL